MAASLQAGPEGVKVETPHVLFSAKYRVGNVHEFDASGDGQKFAVIDDTRADAMLNRLTVIMNWQAVVAKREQR
jgi:hypothetical protein